MPQDGVGIPRGWPGIFGLELRATVTRGDKMGWGQRVASGTQGGPPSLCPFITNPSKQYFKGKRRRQAAGQGPLSTVRPRTSQSHSISAWTVCGSAIHCCSQLAGQCCCKAIPRPSSLSTCTQATWAFTQLWAEHQAPMPGAVLLLGAPRELAQTTPGSLPRLRLTCLGSDAMSNVTAKRHLHECHFPTFDALFQTLPQSRLFVGPRITPPVHRSQACHVLGFPPTTRMSTCGTKPLALPRARLAGMKCSHHL